MEPITRKIKEEVNLQLQRDLQMTVCQTTAELSEELQSVSQTTAELSEELQSVGQTTTELSEQVQIMTKTVNKLVVQSGNLQFHGQIPKKVFNRYKSNYTKTTILQICEYRKK